LLGGEEAIALAPAFDGEDKPAQPIGATDPEPTTTGRRRWLAPSNAAIEPEAAAGIPTSEAENADTSVGDEQTPSPPKIGGTLFERMSSVTRGAALDEDETPKDPPYIPRFLNRQNNQ